MQAPTTSPAPLTQAELPARAPHAGDPLLRLLADAVPVMLAYFGASDLRCVFANQRYAQFAGLTTSSIIGRTVREIIGEAAWQTILPHVQRALAGHTEHYTRDHVLADGQVRALETSLVPHLAAPAAGGAPATVGAFVLINDITHHRHAERVVRESDERMRKFAAATEEGIAFHTEGVILDCNEALQRLTGFKRAELVGRRVIDFALPEYRQQVRDYVRGGREDPYEVAVRHKHGHTVQFEVVGKTMPLVAGGYRVVVVRDITARKHAQERAEFLALHDTLTLLPNRRHLMQHLGPVLARAQAEQRHVALLFIDLDHFKTINESLGHEAGDRLLCDVAARLQAEDTGALFAARVGGDQFVAVLPGLGSGPEAAGTAEALLARLRAPYAIGGVPLSIASCIGISVFPQDGLGADELLHRAATAMQHAKDSGRGMHKFYAPGMEGQPAALLRQEHLLRQAVLQGSFVLHYQPQVRVDDGQLHGFEALVRWRHPDRGLVGPDDFVALAESRGLITPIGRWVLHEACRQLKAWHDEGLPRVPVAVNLSAIELRQRDVVADIARVLHECELQPRYLEVEITESALMQHGEQTHAMLRGLQALGVAVAVDDFGTGYSSLAYLKRYPLNKIKVDRSFVADTPGDADDVAIVTAVVQMARSLQLQSVAEGVETAEQLALLRRLGCELAQGFGIAQPMDAEQAGRWLRALPA